MALSLRPLNPDLYPPGVFRIPRQAKVFRVGREQGNDLQVNHASVSALHAKIEASEEAGVEVIDCGSSNGTFLNGIKVVDRKQLADGDLLRFATAEFRVTSEQTPHLNGSVKMDGVTQAINLSSLGSPEFQPNSLERERGQLRKEVERLSAEVTEINGYLLEWQSCVASRDEVIAKLSGSLATQGESAGQQAAAHLADIAGLSRTIKEQEIVHQSLVAARAAEISSLSAKLQEREGAFASLSEGSGKEIQRLTRNLTERESEVASLSEALAVQEEVCLQLKREIEDHIQREQRNLSQISETRKEQMDLEGRIAALHYELSTRDGNILQLSNQRQQLQQGNDLLLTEIDRWHAALEAESQNLVAAREARELAEANAESILRRLMELGDRLSADWSAWFRSDEESSTPEDADANFSRLASLAGRIRGELDLIEPVWQQFGDHVQEELAARCGAFREEESELTREILDRQSELGSLKADLDQFRELIDVEVRRAQGLSRRGTEIEIPERFESMVIARDREQEIYRSLIERTEVLDRLLEGYRHSRKLREVVIELSEFRARLVAILDASGVQAFDVPVKTMLTLKHRKEVQILSRKGWGTRQYSDFPFQPGEVVKVIRPGYRVGEGEYAIILRKVEVLIRGVGD